MNIAKNNNRGSTILIIGVLLFSFMLMSLVMMSNSLDGSDRFGNLFLYLLIFNALGLIALVSLIILNFKRLARELKNKTAGAVLTVRMVILFSVLSITPVLMLYYFSLDFLLRGIDNWFDLRVENALDDSLELSRLSLDGRMRELLKITEQVAEELSDISDAATPFEIDDLRVGIAAEELTLLTRQGSILTSSSDNSASLVPDRPDETVLLQLQQGSSYVGLDPVEQGGLYIRVVVNVPEISATNTPRIIQALFPVTERINVLANNVQNAFVDYQKLSYLREQLKLSFVMILTLVLLFSIFSVIWAAFYSAKKLAQPVSDLAEGTKAVAAGDYNMELPVTSRDELGFLVASFNDMTQKIASARDEVQQGQDDLEAERSRLQTILDQLSSGVLVLDTEGRFMSVNNSARQILGIPETDTHPAAIDGLLESHPHLDEMFQIIYSWLDTEGRDQREQITVFGHSGRQDIMLSGTTLPASHATSSALAIVLDDITALLQGEKDAAWSEMARRLAHEIKNPLTPIQLAAERLRHKYINSLPEKDSETLDRLTNTIVQQVETMKGMVNSFSDYARSPAIEPVSTEVNQLLLEVVDLYSINEKNIHFHCDFESDIPAIQLDQKRFRQVFNNLLKNSIDASPNDSDVAIKTRIVGTPESPSLEISIRDSGRGIDENIQDQIFDPYVTTKKKGTGLGLAIVKKIIEEHGGVVWLKNNQKENGACVTIKLPISNRFTHENPQGTTVT